jgi:DNA-directed RNA polymerase beta' subunit
MSTEKDSINKEDTTSNDNISHKYYILDDDKKNFFLVNNTWDMDDKNFGNYYSKCNVCNNSKLPSNYSYINNKKDECFCTGHFGKLDLKTYIIHPLFKSLYKTLCKDYCIDIKFPLEDQKEMLPEIFRGIIFRYIPIPHLNIRNSSDIEWDNKLTHLYNTLVDIVKKPKPSREKIENIVKKIFSKEGIIGLMSTKQGVFRKICFGKRLESSARSVITGDPNINIDQVHIPIYLANHLYTECIIDSEDIQYYLEKGVPLTKDQSIKGIKAIRKIMNDDIVLINRQPTLSYGSILGFRAKIRNDDNKTIGINPNVTKTFNADFDGDEMNIFYFPQSEDLKKMHIINFPDCINNIQDIVTAKYIFNDKKYDDLNDFKKDIDINTNKEKTIELYEKLTNIGLSISLKDMVHNKYINTDLYKIITSGSKGNKKNKEQIMDKIGNQYVSGNVIGIIESNYVKGLNQDDFFIHQSAAREGIVSTGVNTSTTGYINRKTTRSMADVISTEEYYRDKRVIRDYKGIISYI